MIILNCIGVHNHHRPRLRQPANWSRRQHETLARQEGGNIMPYRLDWNQSSNTIYRTPHLNVPLLLLIANNKPNSQDINSPFFETFLILVVKCALRASRGYLDTGPLGNLEMVNVPPPSKEQSIPRHLSTCVNMAFTYQQLIMTVVPPTGHLFTFIQTVLAGILLIVRSKRCFLMDFKSTLRLI